MLPSEPQPTEIPLDNEPNTSSSSSSLPPPSTEPPSTPSPTPPNTNEPSSTETNNINNTDNNDNENDDDTQDPFSPSFYKDKLLSLIKTATHLYETTTSNFNLNSIINDLISFDSPSSYDITPEDNECISSFITDITSKENISPQNIYNIQLRKDDYIFYKHLLETYIITQSKTYDELTQYNFNIFSQILYSFLDTFSFNDLEHDSSLLLLIITICETTFTTQNNNNNNAIYLCSQLNTHPFLMNKAIWSVLFSKKVHSLLDKEINVLYATQLKQKNTNAHTNMFTKHLTRLLNIEHEMLDESELVAYYGSDDVFENYVYLDIAHKRKIEEEFHRIVHQTLKEFIEHLCNFNFTIESIFEFIVNESSKLNLKSASVNYYLLYASTSELSVKLHAKWKCLTYSERMKIMNVKKNKHIVIVSKYPLDMKKQHEKEIVISNVMKYLPCNEYINYFILNKQISMKLKLKFYQQYLLNVLANRNNTYTNYIDIHIKAWNSILLNNTITNNVNVVDYNTTLNNANANINKDLLTLIESDVYTLSSTTTTNNTNNAHQPIINILLSLTHNNPQLKYYQGLHYISTFLYLLTKNESGAFVIMNALYNHSHFKTFVDNNSLDNIKCNVYIFERLLQLYLPSLSYYLSTRAITANYYIIPFMVTLFTNVLQYNDGEIPLIVMHIWNEFIIGGYKSLFKSLLTLLYVNIKDIYYFNDNVLLSYLINDLVKSSKMRNDNYDNWIQCERMFTISKKTIRNLQDEFIYENMFN